MMCSKKLYDLNGRKVYFKIGAYDTLPAVLAISVYDESNKPCGELSVNLDNNTESEIEVIFGCTYIDTNNHPYAEEFLKGLGCKHYTKMFYPNIPVTKKHGSHEYPLYSFPKELLRKMDEEGYERYERAHEESMEEYYNIRSALHKCRNIYPVGTKLKIFCPSDPQKEQNTYTLERIDNNFILHCKDDNGASVELDIDSEMIYKIDQPVLIGFAGDKKQKLANVLEVARFIVQNGIKHDIEIYDDEGMQILDTFGPFLNRISQDYRKELINILNFLLQNDEEEIRQNACSDVKQENDIQNIPM